MLRRKLKKTNDHSRVEDSVRSSSFQEESVVLSNDVDVDNTDGQPTSWNAEEKKIFEDQLEALQDQLIATMMENQKLGLSYLIDNSRFSFHYFS